MPISCLQDGTGHPDHAKFCMECGRPLRGVRPGDARPQAQWEYSEVVVPLGAVGQTMHAALQLAMEHYRQALAEHLPRAAADGWEPDGPTDRDFLMSHGRVRSRISAALIPPFEFRSATLTFKRRAQAQPP